MVAPTDPRSIEWLCQAALFVNPFAQPQTEPPAGRGEFVDFILRLFAFLDRHAAIGSLVAAIGLVLAGVGLLFTKQQLSLYREELRDQAKQRERLAWERILKLLHQVVLFAAQANQSSAVHSPIAKQNGVLPPDLAAKYEPAQVNLLAYWHQLRVELSLMPDGPVVQKVDDFMRKYDSSADARASKQFLDALPTITHLVSEHAQKSFAPTR